MFKLNTTTENRRNKYLELPKKENDLKQVNSDRIFSGKNIFNNFHSYFSLLKERLLSRFVQNTSNLDLKKFGFSFLSAVVHGIK